MLQRFFRLSWIIFRRKVERSLCSIGFHSWNLNFDNDTCYSNVYDCEHCTARKTVTFMW